MRLLRRSYRSLVFIALAAGSGALGAACSVYDADLEFALQGDGSAGTAGQSAGGTGGAAGSGGSAGTGGDGTGGTSGADDGSTTDADPRDVDAAFADIVPPRDTFGDTVGDAVDSGSRADGGPSDTPPRDTASPSDVSTGGDAYDAVTPPVDVAVDAPTLADADATMPDADAAGPDIFDSGTVGTEILPPHGWPMQKPDAGAPFDSRCASNEVITGFVGRAGVQTDAIGSTCSKLIGGVLSSPHNLPLNGLATGGNAVTVTCPANHVAIGIVGHYGHNTMWQEDVTTAIGLVCKNLGSTATQIVAITSQPALDPGYTTFREDCTLGRYMTDISGRPDSNSLGYTVQQFGGECALR